MTVPKTLGKYLIHKRLGGGHFGEVYLPHDRALACDKAIKLIEITDPAEVMKKLEEAQILDKCRHKHIVQINEANIFDNMGHQLLVLDLEYLPEGSLEGELKNRWISAKEACSRICCVLSGLHFAHSNGYLHRDVKPGNVLICADSTKLSDFGLATTALNLAGSDQGYLAHCPPEFYTTNETTIQTDIFAVGLTLFRVVNNIDDWRDLLDKTLNADEHIRKGTLVKAIGFAGFVPERLKRIINKACNPDPTKRYKSALEMKNALDALRFDIEWIMASSNKWLGYTDGNNFEISIAVSKKGYFVIFKRNDRKDNSKCVLCSDKSAAQQKAEELVCQTILK